MAEKDISEKELDAMIDASIKSGKEENVDKKEKPKKEELTKAAGGAPEKKQPKVTEANKSESTHSPKEKKKEPALKPVEGYDPWTILTYPHITEKSMNLVERNNVLVFIVSMKATKHKVKEAVEKGFGCRVVSVRVEITRKNQKKAYVRLAEGVLASDIATRLGMI